MKKKDPVKYILRYLRSTAKSIWVFVQSIPLSTCRRTERQLAPLFTVVVVDFQRVLQLKHFESSSVILGWQRSTEESFLLSYWPWQDDVAANCHRKHQQIFYTRLNPVVVVSLQSVVLFNLFIIFVQMLFLFEGNVRSILVNKPFCLCIRVQTEPNSSACQTDWNNQRLWNFFSKIAHMQLRLRIVDWKKNILFVPIKLLLSHQISKYLTPTNSSFYLTITRMKDTVHIQHCGINCIKISPIFSRIFISH